MFFGIKIQVIDVRLLLGKTMEVTYTEIVPILLSFGSDMGKLFSSYDEHEIKTVIDFLSKSIEVFKIETEKLKHIE